LTHFKKAVIPSTSYLYFLSCCFWFLQKNK